MQAFPVKIVVRKLPHSLAESAFVDMVRQCGVEDAKLLYFVPGFVKNKNRTAWTRAYVSVGSPRAAEAFHAAFLKLWPTWEIPSRVVPCVEPAPFQRMPLSAEKPDEESGKLEEYEPFKKFVEELNAKKVTLPPADVQLEKLQSQGVASNEPIISPLLKELIEKKQAQLEKELAMRQKGGHGGGGGRGKRGKGGGGGGGGGKGKQPAGQPQQPRKGGEGGGGRSRGPRKGPRRPRNKGQGGGKQATQQTPPKPAQ